MLCLFIVLSVDFAVFPRVTIFARYLILVAVEQSRSWQISYPKSNAIRKTFVNFVRKEIGISFVLLLLLVCDSTMCLRNAQLRELTEQKAINSESVPKYAEVCNRKIEKKAGASRGATKHYFLHDGKEWDFLM